MYLFEVVDIFIALEWGGASSSSSQASGSPVQIRGIVLGGPVSDAAEGGPGAFLLMVVSTKEVAGVCWLDLRFPTTTEPLPLAMSPTPTVLWGISQL